MYDLNNYNNLIVKTSKEKEQYNDLKDNLQYLLKNLPYIQKNLKAAESNFLDGGFVNKGETFDKGKIKECNAKIDSICQNINNVLDKIEGKISLLENTTNKYESNYDNNNSNYKREYFQEEDE